MRSLRVEAGKGGLIIQVPRRKGGWREIGVFPANRWFAFNRGELMFVVVALRIGVYWTRSSCTIRSFYCSQKENPNDG